MWSNPQETADLVRFTEEILNGKLHFLCRVRNKPFSIHFQVAGKSIACNVIVYAWESPLHVPNIQCNKTFFRFGDIKEKTSTFKTCVPI